MKKSSIALVFQLHRKYLEQLDDWGFIDSSTGKKHYKDSYLWTRIANETGRKPHAVRKLITDRNPDCSTDDKREIISCFKEIRADIKRRNLGPHVPKSYYIEETAAKLSISEHLADNIISSYCNNRNHRIIFPKTQEC